MIGHSGGWSGRRDSNSRPTVPKTVALPGCATPRRLFAYPGRRAEERAKTQAAGLSRKDEYEADEYAAALLTKSGIGTEPQKALLTRLSALTGMRGAPPVWLASHPKTEDRVAAIEALEERWRVG